MRFQRRSVFAGSRSWRKWCVTKPPPTYVSPAKTRIPATEFPGLVVGIPAPRVMVRFPFSDSPQFIDGLGNPLRCCRRLVHRKLVLAETANGVKRDAEQRE